MYASEFIGKPIISLYDGKILAKVRDLVFDKKMTKLKFVLTDGNTELSTRDIHTAGAGAVIVRNASALSPASRQGNYPAFAGVFSVTGEYLGRSGAIEIDDAYRVAGFFTDVGDRIDTERLHSVGSELVLVNPDGIKFARLAPAKKSSKKTVIKRKYVTECNFLIGRVITRDLKGAGGGVLIRRNTVVSHEVIGKAVSYGKLTELMRSSKPKPAYRAAGTRNGNIAGR